MKKALYYKKLDANKVQCELCPQMCVISEGKTGICFGRRNIGGELFAENYGHTISISMDPIEKKPLYHFYPGKDILSIGPNGCNLRCIFCQNYHISQQISPTKKITPEELLKYCEQTGSIGVAYTYTEPLIWYEFIYDSAKLLHENGKIAVLVTNGTINEEPLREILPLIDAMNIDLKAFTDEFYKKYCSGFLEAVKNTIKISSRFKVTHIEITDLIIPDLNDSKEEIQNLVDFIAEIDNEIPLHFSRYFPAYKLNKPSTPASTLQSTYEIAKKKLKYVYVGNISLSHTSDTFCPNCGELLIKRGGFYSDIVNMNGENRCKNCNYLIKGVHLFA
ncbi:MAG: AmmeMemoRadiSam system radical SAM enzyme [Candidatus Cloacimonetes bacterium]|nr:AmmeMemoRadiSam system radical SAM enzyme [Candidatus Cloacimonadota bacterium]